MTDRGSDTKACPFCAETIKTAAIKCKHCGSELSDAPPSPPVLRKSGHEVAAAHPSAQSKDTGKGSSNDDPGGAPSSQKVEEKGKKGGWGIGCLYGLGLFIAVVVFIVGAVVVRDCSDSNIQRQRRLDSANMMLKTAEKSSNPCEDLANTIDAVKQVTSHSNDTSKALNKRLVTVAVKCRDRLCRDLAAGFVGDVPNEKSVAVAREIQTLRGGLLFEEPCSRQIKLATEYMKAHDEVAAARELFAKNKFSEGAAKITVLRDRGDPVLRNVLTAKAANKMLTDCIAKARKLADDSFSAEDFEKARGHYDSALACDDRLPPEQSLDRADRRGVESKRESADRRAKLAARRAEREEQRARAEEAKLDARCRARGLALLRCDEQCERRSERIADPYNSMMSYMDCADRCGEIPEDCRR